MKKILMLTGALIISAVSFADLQSTIKNHYSNKTIDLAVVSKPKPREVNSGGTSSTAVRSNYLFRTNKIRFTVCLGSNWS